MMELPRVTVIIAIDHRIALSALAHHYQHLTDNMLDDTKIDKKPRGKYDIARDYLGKIIQLPINLDQPDQKAVSSYIKHLFKGVLYKAPARDESSSFPNPDIDLNFRSPDETDASRFQNSDELAKQNATESPPAKNQTMKHSLTERQKFVELADLFNFHNPRQLKRLHSSYRLLRAYLLTGEIKNLRYMSGLFWFEYLYSLQRGKRTTRIKELDECFKDRREGTAEICKYRELFTNSNDYDEIKRLVEPFVLPQAQQDK